MIKYTIQLPWQSTCQANIKNKTHHKIIIHLIFLLK